MLGGLALVPEPALRALFFAFSGLPAPDCRIGARLAFASLRRQSPMRADAPAQPFWTAMRFFPLFHRHFSTLARAAMATLGVSLCLSQGFFSPAVAQAQSQIAPQPGDSLVALQAWAALPATAHDVCPFAPAAQLTVVEDPILRLNDRLGFAEIMSQVGAARPDPYAAPGSHSATMGFFQPRWHWAFSYRPIVIEANGAYAVCVSRMDAVLTSSPTIYLARELPAGSCARQDVLTHEHTHYLIDTQEIEHLRHQAPEIAAQYPAVYWGRTRQEAIERAGHGAQNYLSALQQRLIDLRAPPQLAHDSPAEYARGSRACNGEIVRILRAAIAANPALSR